MYICLFKCKNICMYKCESKCIINLEYYQIFEIIDYDSSTEVVS